jgi:hypothetical protein
MYVIAKLYFSKIGILIILIAEIRVLLLRFEVFTAVTMKNGVFWDVTPCGSWKNRRFRGT